MLRYFWVCIVALTAFAARPAHAKDVYKFEFSRTDTPVQDSAEVFRQDDKTYFVISNPFGIGRVRILLTEGKWPNHLLLRYRYKQSDGFKYLESWKLTTARIVVNGSAQFSSAMPFYFRGADEKAEDANHTPAGTLDIKVKKLEGAMELSLPDNILEGSKEIQLEWIDAYRTL